MGQPIFTGTTTTRNPHNVFDLSHDRKFSGKMGNLIPICLIDTVPGDKISLNTASLLRFAPLIAPIMHSVSVYTHYFYVPNRILWSNWEKFITGGPEGTDTSVPPFTEIDLKDVTPGSLTDYLGLPVGTDVALDGGLEVSAIPFAVYNKIYDDYYRDENLIPEDEAAWTLIDGFNDTAGPLKTAMKKRSWQHDYFTSALPFAQRGPEAMLPLGAEAPVRAWTNETPPPQGFPLDQEMRFSSSGDGTGMPVANPLQTGSGSAFNLQDPLDPLDNVYVDIADTNYADLSQATASSIVDVRRAFRLQEYLEKNARGGTRYTEWLKVWFNVNSSDARLQRAEYLGGTKTPVKISEVLQTGATAAPGGYTDNPQGTMAGHGISVGQGGYVSHRSEEHGYIMGIMSIMPNSAYQQGIPRHWSRTDKFDYYTPPFAHIGEQPIRNKELYIGVDGTTIDETFGYTPRYAEYKFINSSVHGDYRTSLDFWHMGRKFSSDPALNQDFIEMDDTEVDRIFAVQDGTDNLWIHIYNSVKAQRQMAVYGEPKF